MVQKVNLVAHIRGWIAIDSRSGLIVLHVCYRKCAHCLSFAALSGALQAPGVLDKGSRPQAGDLRIPGLAGSF